MNDLFSSDPAVDDDRWREVSPPATAAANSGGTSFRHATTRQKDRLLALLASADPMKVCELYFVPYLRLSKLRMNGTRRRG